jgi:ring-1,2-phenylacetyl-CoA epoxidase subunit PaaD
MVTTEAAARGTAPVTEADVARALATVADPEIPTVSIVELGMLDRVSVDDRGIHVELLPTFVACPAIDAIRASVVDALSDFGRPVHVDMSFRVPWTSDRITEQGRQKLRRSGFAPPVDDERDVRCPYCGSANVALDNLFGPTQCRSLRYCRGCRQPFEQFKSV